mmetsp:Transcript_11799/g.27333  ORF Transcript_11799/g.27333 Transcript_11799/m.27333 type:complete len:191 (+) Transcript_11799:596-1168(+)
MSSSVDRGLSCSSIRKTDSVPGEAPKLHHSLRQSASSEDGDGGGEHAEPEESESASEVSAEEGGWQMLVSIRRRPEGVLEGMLPKKKRAPAWSNEREAATRVGSSRGETAMVPLRLFLGRLVCGSVQRRSRSERLMTERDRFILNGRLGTRLVVLRRVVTAAPSVERLGVRIRVRVSLTPQNLSVAGMAR